MVAIRGLGGSRPGIAVSSAIRLRHVPLQVTSCPGPIRGGGWHSWRFGSLGRGVRAAMSRHTELSVGCCCEDENRCHRSILGDLLAMAGAEMTA